MALQNTKGKASCNLQRFRAIQKGFRKEVQGELNAVARDGAEACKTMMSTGAAGIAPDTGALETSFYPVNPKGNSGYRAAISRAEAAYATRYPAEKFERVKEAPLKVGSLQSGYASALTYMRFWEYGHQNIRTGRTEKAPILRPVRDELRATIKQRFKPLMKKASLGIR